MSNYNRYSVTSTDIFNYKDYPEIEADLRALATDIAFMPGYGKVNATVSFLKNHCIANEFVNANPVLVEMIRFGSSSTGRIESLFESCRSNPAFLRDFEAYIREGLTKAMN